MYRLLTSVVARRICCRRCVSVPDSTCNLQSNKCFVFSCDIYEYIRL
uniref:Uncharacterized protein n=1 Tax=Arundo donax TaxID=35708 RepID=A0A0A9DP53_ARUDO